MLRILCSRPSEGVSIRGAFTYGAALYSVPRRVSMPDMLVTANSRASARQSTPFAECIPGMRGCSVLHCAVGIVDEAACQRSAVES